jgi:cysteine desulfurase/selenocysteine lyase
MGLERARGDFPLLGQKNGGKPLVYLDNASMSLKPQQVVDAMCDYYCNYSVAAGRGAYRLAREVTTKCEEARERVQRFVGAERQEEIVFTKNTTEGINVVARNLGLAKGDVVLTTDKEHNSNLVPWHEMRKLNGIKHVIVPSKEDNTFDIEAFKARMSRKVKLVSMCHCSNLDGCKIPARDVVEIAHDNGTMVMLDGAQSAPHMPLDMRRLDVDLYAFSLHKMLGPTGMGILYGKYDLLERLNPLFHGGSMIEDTTYECSVLSKPPRKFEGGLQNYAGIFGSGAAIEYLRRIPMEDIEHNNYVLNKYITDSLLGVPELTLIGPDDPRLRAGIFNFNVKGWPSNDIASELDRKANLMIRSGFHCVDSWFNARGIDGSVRVSTYFYNTLGEVKSFVEQLEALFGEAGHDRRNRMCPRTAITSAVIGKGRGTGQGHRSGGEVK